jgi:hypothetical protein
MSSSNSGSAVKVTEITGDFGSLITGIIYAIITATIAAIVIYRFFPAFFLFATGGDSSSARDQAKRHLSIGFGILILSIFFTPTVLWLNPTFGDFSVPPISSQKTASTNSSLVGLSGNEDDSFGSSVSAGTGAKDIEFIKKSENSVRGVLGSAGIAINRGACDRVNQPLCTTVGGLNQSTIDMLKELKNGCACNIQVTGGTEWWLHSATTKHVPGGGAVDISKPDGLASFLQQNGKEAPRWPICRAAYAWNGFYFCDEGNHWHAQPQ